MGNSRTTVAVRKATPSDSTGIAKVHVNCWRTTYLGIVSESYLNSLSYEARERSWAGSLSSGSTTRVYVAEDLSNGLASNRIIGFVSGGPNRSNDSKYAGELYAIYILKDYQGLGIGKTLVASLVTELLDDGIPSMIVWVLADNPFRKFYERLGGKFTKSQYIEIGDQKLEEVAYGWVDVRSLLSTSQTKWRIP